MYDVAEIQVASHGERAVDARDVVGLYRTQGWWPEREAARVAEVLTAGPAVGAWRDQQLVGFARAVTDGVFRAYLEDLVVSPDFRGRGIGHLLVRRLVNLLPPTAITSLFCAPELADFYVKEGFGSTSQVVLHRDPHRRD